MCSYARKKERRRWLGLGKGRRRLKRSRRVSSKPLIEHLSARRGLLRSPPLCFVRPLCFLIPRPLLIYSSAWLCQRTSTFNGCLCGPAFAKAEADKSMPAFNLTQPREQTTKLEKSRGARKNEFLSPQSRPAPPFVIRGLLFSPPFYLVSPPRSQRVLSDSLSLLAFYIAEEKCGSLFPSLFFLL